MKIILFLILSFTCMLGLAVPVCAAEDTVMIESESNWDYLVVDDKGFENIDPNWNTVDYNVSDWGYGTAPFGDRILPDRAESYGWVGEDDGIFLRKEFKLRSATVLKDMNFYIRTFYDNTIHIYLNGVEIFANDHSGSSDWVDEYTLYKLDNIAEHLVLGKNVLAVSVHDNVGGREFDLSFFATNEELDDSTNAPIPENPTDDPSDTPSDIPTDFGNTIPFTKAPANIFPPVITEYVPTKQPTAIAKPSYVAPIAMISASLLISIGMMIVALIISRKTRTYQGEQQ